MRFGQLLGNSIAHLSTERIVDVIPETPSGSVAVRTLSAALDVDVDTAAPFRPVRRRSRRVTTRSSVPGTDPARNMTLLTTCPTVGANCRGFVTSDVMDDFVGVGLRESIFSELGIAETKMNTDLPRFSPSM